MAWWEYESGKTAGESYRELIQQKYGVTPRQTPQQRAPSMPRAPAQRQVSYAPPSRDEYEGPSAPSWFEGVDRWTAQLPGAERLTEAVSQWRAPRWLEQAGDWASAMLRQRMGRHQAVWEKPEQRTMAPPVQVSTIPELRTQQEQQLGQWISALPFMEPEQAQKTADYLKVAPGIGQLLGGVPHLRQALQRYESETQKETPLAQAARRVEQVGGLGLQALQEPTELTQSIAGSAAIALQPESEGMDPADWMPLTESGYSVLLDIAEWKKRLKGEGAAWGPLLKRVKKGEKAEDIAEEIYNPVLEMVGLTALDPLWVLGMGRKGRELTRVIDDAAGKYATAVDDLEPVARGLEAAMEQGRAVDILTRPAEEAGVFDRLFGKWKDIKKAVDVRELQATSKVSQDLQDLHIVATNAVIDAGSTEEAAARIASWLDNPLMAVEELGESVASEKGRRVAEILRQLDPEDLITLREGRPFSAEAFGKELLERAAPILEKEHGVEAWKAAEQLTATVGSKKGKRLKELLSQLDPEDLATLREGRTFTTKQLEKELLQKIGPILEKEYGLDPLREYRRFAKTFKNWASEFYLNLNPSYALKNATNNAGTLAYDGILAMDRMPNIEAELQRFGASTARLAGQEAGAIGAFTASKSKLPGVLGKVAQKGRWLASESAIGEEAFVRRGYLAALRKTWNRLWHSGQGIPELPPQLVDAVGPQMADDINRAVAQGVSWEEIEANVARVMKPQSPGDTLSLVLKYVEPGEMESLSPAAWDYLHGRIRSARTVEEAQAAIDDVRQTVREMGDLAYRREILEPSRKVFSNVEEVEVVQNMVDDLAADARKFGIAGTEVDAELARIGDRLDGLRNELMAAGGDAVREAGEIGGRDAAEVLYWANRNQQEAVAATRLEVDALRKQAWDLYDAHPELGAEIWDNYFGAAGTTWERTFTQNLAVMDEARGGLQRLDAGESLAGIVGMDSRQVAETRIARQVELERAAGRDIAEVKGFQARLNVLRSRVDLAQENAQRVGFQVPDRESLDILDDADRLTQDIARKWRAESDALRAQYKGANARQRKQIAEAQDELAQKLFGDQEAKWQAAERDLRARLGGVAEDVVRPPVEGGPVEAVEAAAPTRTFSQTELTERITGLIDDVNYAAGESYFKHRTHLMNALKRKLGKDFKWPHPDADAEWNRLADLAGEYAGGDKAAVAKAVEEAAEAAAPAKPTVADARAVPGATERPGLVDLTKITEPHQLAALDAIEQGIVREWPQWQQRTSNIYQQRVVDAWLGEAVRPAWRDARLVAAQGADSLMKRSLLDYTQQNRIDGFLDLIYPYHYWYTRTGVNWMRRMANNPAVLGTYIRYKQTMKDLNEQRGLRSRFEGKWRVKLPDGVLPEWTDRYYYFDPVQALFPFSQWDRTDWDDDEEANGALTTIYQESKKFGMRPFAFIEVPLQYTGQLGESREEIGNLIPLTAHVKGITALTGLGPVGGVNIEAPLRKAAGLQEQEPWDPYRVTRQLGSMSGDDPELYDTALKAEQLQLAVKEGELELRDATGESGEVSRALASIQKEYGWSDEELAEAQRLLREALQRAGVERGIASVGSITTGMPSSVLATGEQTQKALQEEAREKAWRLDNPEGSREEYTQFKLDHPEIYAREAQYSTIQGETQQEGLSPAARANWLKLKAAKDKVYESYQKKIDAHLRKKPWDGKGVSAIKKKQKAAIEELKAKYPMPEMEGDIPNILYGMNPPEMWDSVVEDALYDLKEKGPQVEDYANKKSEVDWSKYYAALDAWEAKLPAELPGVGAIKVGIYAGMDTQTALDNFNQRHDSPLEAAKNVYQDLVASPEWDSYHQAEAAEEAKWPGVKALQDQYWALDKDARRSFISEHPRLKEYWDYKEARGASPYDRTVGTVAAVKAVDLIPWIQEQYQARGWTEQELMRELKGVIFKPLGKQRQESTGTKEKKEKETDRGNGAGKESGSDYRIPYDIYEAMQEQKAGRPWRQVYGKPWYEKELPQWAPPQR